MLQQLGKGDKISPLLVQYGVIVIDHVSPTKNEVLVLQSPILPNEGNLAHSQSEGPIPRDDPVCSTGCRSKGVVL